MQEMLTTWSNRTKSRLRELSVKFLDSLILELGLLRLRLEPPTQEDGRWQREDFNRYYRTDNR